MMLGELLSALARMSDDEIAAGLEGDDVLLARLRSAASAHGESLGDYLHCAVRRFLERGGEEDWTQAMGYLQSDPAPGDRLIEIAIERQLRHDGH